MARILALDTTAEPGSIAVFDSSDGRLYESAVHSPEGFGHVLFDRVRSLLDRAGIGVGDVDGFAAASGPGSFTGVRVGLTAVKGLAEAGGRRVVVVSNLKALAYFGSAALRAAVIDARRGEVYGAVYDAELREVQPERVLKFRDWVEGLPDGVEFVAANFAPFAGALAGTRFETAAVAAVQGTLAGAIARIGAGEFAAGGGVDPAGVDANYVRRSDAELFWSEDHWRGPLKRGL